VTDKPDTPRTFGEVEEGATYVLRPGGYVVIQDTGGLIAIVETRKGFHLPGGGLEPGETFEQAAIREALEESGLHVAIDSQLGVADELVYDDADACHYRKRCAFFLGRVLGPGGDPEPGHRLSWVPLAEAVRCLRLGSERWAAALCLGLGTEGGTLS
jgi:8-oxo-dGTP diphosphatase